MISLLKKHGTSFILIGLLAAISLGIFYPTLLITTKFLGDIFINLLKLFALPLIAATLMTTIGQMGENLKSVGNLMRHITSYMFLSEISAVIIALTLFNFIPVGTGVDATLILQGEAINAASSHTNFHLATFLTHLFPQNIFASLVNFDLLPIVIFSAIFGCSCAIVGKTAQPLIQLGIAVREVSSRCLKGVMLFAPFGIFSLVGTGVAAANLNGTLTKTLTALLAFVAVLVLGLILHALWQLILAASISKQKISAILKQSIPLFSTAFATSSSVATLPFAIDTAEQLGAHPETTRLMLPLCASINVGGMMMYEVAATLFFAQILGHDLSLSQQALIAFAGILGGMAEGGIPETSLVSLVVVFRIVNIPLSAISFLLPLDRIIDRFRTMVNIFGNTCGVITVDHFTNKNRNANNIQP